MNGPPPFVQSILHPSDFSAASENAFAHALAVALLRRARLTVLHVGSDHLGEDEWSRFPAIRATLERWGILEPGAPRSAVFEQLGVRVEKVSVRGRNPAKEISEFLGGHPSDLVVLATEGREGLPAWLRPSTAERVARRTEAMTLFVPQEARGFVSTKDGSTTLRRILVPVDHEPDPREALAYASRAATAFGDPPVDLALLHVGDEDGILELDLPEDEGQSWRRVSARGDVVESILSTAAAQPADLLVMVTAGHDGILDVLRGSVTEQVLRRAPCPVLAVPLR